MPSASTAPARCRGSIRGRGWRSTKPLILVAGLCHGCIAFARDGIDPDSLVRTWSLGALSAVCMAALLGLAWCWHAQRLRRADARAREHAMFEIHDQLLQGAQGLVLNLQIVAGDLPRGDPRRRRLEGLLDEADLGIARARDRVHALSVGDAVACPPRRVRPAQNAASTGTHP